MERAYAAHLIVPGDWRCRESRKEKGDDYHVRKSI